MAKVSVTVKRIALLVIFLFILSQIWSRVHIVVWTTMGEFIGLIVVIAVIFLLIDHVINHGKP